jgi:hypothetical protein
MIAKQPDHDQLLVYLLPVILPVAIIIATNMDHNEYFDGIRGIYNLRNTIFTHRH